MLRTGSAPVSFILTEKEAVMNSQQTDTTTFPQLPAASHGTAREKHQAVTPSVYFLTAWQPNVSPFVSVQPPGYSGL